MAKFPIIKTGKKEDGNHFSLISSMIDGYQMSAFITTQAPQDIKKGLEIPEQLVKKISWRL